MTSTVSSILHTVSPSPAPVRVDTECVSYFPFLARLRQPVVGRTPRISYLPACLADDSGNPYRILPKAPRPIKHIYTPELLQLNALIPY